MSNSPLMRAAYALTGLSDPSMGDEREQAVILRAYAFAMVLAMLLGFATSILFAVFGLGLWSVAPLMIVGIPSWATIWFAAREGVDLVALLDRAGKKRMTLVWAGTIGYLLLWCGALAFHILTGNPLISVDFDFGGDPGSETLIGGVIGGTVGLLAAVIALKLKSRTTQRRLAAEDAD